MGTDGVDVVVVGGGIVGLVSAHAISRAGLSVAVFDERPGSGATHAAAGMICPGAESSPEDAELAALTLRARQEWPTLADAISETSGVAVSVAEVGSLFVAWEPGDTLEQRRILATATRQGVSSDVVSRDDRPHLFSGLSSRLHTGAFVKEDAHVDPDAIVAALVGQFDGSGALIRERVLSCNAGSNGISVRTVGRTVHGRLGIVATGAAREHLRILEGSTERIRPVRGVTVHLRGHRKARHPMVRGLVGGRGVYVVTRDDGRVVVGATSDEAWDVAVPVWAARQLLDDATKLIPELDECELVECRAGLRPAPVKHSPFFDVIGSGLWAWSSGYYRHGFLLAPIAAERAANFAVSALR
jgi:glycine oxidase